MDAFLDCILRSSQNSRLKSLQVVLTGWVVPITTSRKQILLGFEPTSLMMYLRLTPEITRLLKPLIPSAVESCRGTWTHENTRAYLANNCAPILTDAWQNLICSCGEGKYVVNFSSKSFVGSFENVATSIAIPLLSAMSYLEPMAPMRTSHWRSFESSIQQ